MTRSRPNILSHQIDTAEVDSEVEIDTALNTPSDHKSRSPSQSAPVIEERRRSGPSHLRRTSSTDEYDRNEDDELPSGTSTMFTAEKDGHEDSLEMRLSREGKEENHRNQMNGRGGVNEKRIKLDLGQGEEDIVIIDWLPGDPDNPFNWPDHRKYSFVGVATVITMATAINCTSTTVMATWGTEWFGVSRIQYILSFSIMMWSVSFTPMILAPISEVYGRNIIYQVTSVINAVLFIPQATSHSYAGLLTARFFQGMASSVGNSMVGGTVADLFHAEDRGLAMNIFALMVFVGQSLGAGAFGWIGMYHGIQWCYGVQAILAGVSILLNILVLRETRGDVLLSRRAKRLTKETGVKHMCAAELQKKSFKTLLTITAIRPFQYLVTEPIVAALSTWIAFAWACVFLGGTSYILVFSQYGWNVGQASSVQFTVLIGGVLGFISNYHQEYLYARAALKPKNKGKSPPEARLYWAAYGGLMFPLSTFVFAWTGGRDDIHWIVPAIFLTIGNWGIYCMYSGVFNYLADAYETYSSSAQAAQSFARNIFSGAFPLFARQMYVKLGYPQASTLVASIATVLAAAPILLIIYGKQLRAHSRVASALAKDASHR